MRKRTVLWTALVLVAGVAAAGAALAAKAPPPPSDTPAYDRAAEFTIKGTVSEVKTHQSAGGYEDMHLVMTTPKGDMLVHLGPVSWVAKRGFNFAKGDEVVVTGAKATVNGTDELVAREIAKSGRTLVVRNALGSPVWPRKLPRA